MGYTDYNMAEKSAIILFGGASLAVSYMSEFHGAPSMGEAISIIGKLFFTAALLDLTMDQNFLFPVVATVAVCSSANALRII